MVLPQYAKMTPKQRESAYANSLYVTGKLPNNKQAQDVYDMTGYMPPVTVGGQYGQRAPNPYDMKPRRNISEYRDPIGDEKMLQIRSLEDSIADPTFNADGRLFQGARLSTDPRTGRPSFGSALRPRQYAGGAATQEQADAAARAALMKMSNQGKGYYDTQSGTFYGADARTGTATPSPAAAALMGNPAATRSAQMRGFTGEGPSADTLAENKARTEAQRQSRQSRTADMLLARAQDRGQAREDRQMGVTPQQRMIASLTARQQENEMGIAREQNQAALALENARMGSEEGQNRQRILASLAVQEVEAGLEPGTLTSQFQQGGGAPNPFAAALTVPGAPNAKSPFLGGKASPQQYAEVQGLIDGGDYQGAVDYMKNALGMSDEKGGEIDLALKQLAPGFAASRTADDPTGWANFWSGGVGTALKWGNPWAAFADLGGLLPRKQPSE